MGESGQEKRESGANFTCIIMLGRVYFADMSLCLQNLFISKPTESSSFRSTLREGV